MNSPASFASANFIAGSGCFKTGSRFVITRLQYKRSLPPKMGEDSREKESRQFILRATQQAFPRCQLAIQWWQLELPLQRDSLFQLSQAARSWGLDLSQE